ncbi:MAG: hypothetical protein K9L65_17325 [Chromatiaceae bacterium]|nr:hypothetical protein [Chromatiaceae bacterium]
MSAYSEIELTPKGRLTVRRQHETPEGLRERLDDITAEAQHWLDRIVAIQPGVRLSAVFDLLKANATLMDLYKHNWAHEYAARCDALRAGDLVPDPREDADSTEPPVESLVLSLSQELRIPNELLRRIAAEQDPHSPTSTRYLNLVEDTTDQAGRPVTIKDASRYWHLSGRSAPLVQDTDLSGVHYTAGSQISYSVSFDFDRCIDLPLSIGAGIMSLTISGKRRQDRLMVSVPLGTAQEPPSITLHELIGAITSDFSFYGGPEQTQAEKAALKQSIQELDDDRHDEDLLFGMAHLFCPDGELRDLETHALELEDVERYWDRAKVMEHTGWTEAELNTQSRRGYLLELSAFATRTTPRRTAYPAEQFVSGFDAALMRFLSWIASMSCSDWATHTFLSEWTTANPQGDPINGWAVLALPDRPLEHQELTDPIFKATRNRCPPMRPLFAPTSPKRALVAAFEDFAAQRRLDYEQRDELED